MERLGKSKARKRSGKYYREIKEPGHPLARAGNGMVRYHRWLLYGTIGDGVHKCHWCGKSVEWKSRQLVDSSSLVVDHLDGDKQNNAIENLVPSCHGCNRARMVGGRVRDCEDFLKTSAGGRYRGQAVICQMCGASFVASYTSVARSDGRFCSKVCSGRYGWRLQHGLTVPVLSPKVRI